MEKKSLKDLNLKGKTVLMRVDFNVPIEKGRITDDSRIVASLPSIQYVLKQGAALILMSHLGRPKDHESELSLVPCAKRLSELLKQEVLMAQDSVGESAVQMSKQLKPGQVLLLENLRFEKGEEEPEKDPSFVAKLAELGDCYVNDAFGTAHRAHASTATIAKYFPGQSAMGFLMEKEIAILSSLLKAPQSPFYAIIGGAKISTKVGVLKRLLNLVDELYVGGAMAFTFFKAQGISIGDSPSEDSDIAQDVLRKGGQKIHLPIDLIITDQKKIKTIDVKQGIPAGWQGMDIGPQTVAKWSKELQNAATVFWNGPLGVFEKLEFAEGTRAIAESLTQSHAKVVIGGGDSIAAIQQMGFGKSFAHLSTGGGASLEFLEFGYLPGVDALSQK